MNSAEAFKKVAEIPHARKILKGLLIFLIIFSITGFFVLPPILKSVLLKNLSEKLKREVTIQTLNINPFTFSVSVGGVIINEFKSKEPFISFDKLYLNLQLSSIFRQGIVIREIKLEKPYLNIVRNEDMSYNFSDLIPEGDKKNSESQAPLRFSLNNIQISNGSLDFLDSPKNTKHTVRNAMFMIPFFSNLPYYLDTYVKPVFSADVNNHTVLLKGNTKPFADSLETSLEIDLKNFDLSYYMAYVPFKMDYKLVSGLLDTRSIVTYVQYRDKSPTLGVKGITTLRQFKIQDKNSSPMISMSQAEFAIASSDFMAMNAHFSKISIQSPEINLAIDKTGKLNMLGLIPTNKEKANSNPKKEVGKYKEAAPKPVIDSDEIHLTEGKVFFSDASGEKTFRTVLEKIQLNIKSFSTEKDKKTEAELSFLTEAGEALRLTSGFSIEPLAAEGILDIKQIILKKYSPFYSKYVLFSVEDGKSDFSTRYSFRQTDAEPEIKLSDMAISLSSLRLRGNGETEDFLNLPSSSIKEMSIDLNKQDMVVGEVSVRNGMLLVKRFKDSSLNLLGLLPKPAPSAEQAAQKDKETKPEKPKKPWTVTVKKISVDKYTLKAEDLVPSDPVNVAFEQINFRGDNISTVRNVRGKVSLSLKFGQKGTMTANGSIGIQPVSAQIKMISKNLPVKPVEPYFADRIKIILTDGSVSSDGTIRVSESKDKGLQISYKGQASLSHFASVDKKNADDFLKWESLYLNDMDIGYNPLYLNINEIALTDFYSRLVVNSDGTLNMQNIVEKSEDKTAALDQKTEAQKPEDQKKIEPDHSDKKDVAQKMVKIEKVTLQGGTVNFSDYYIKPNYSANLLEIGGRVSGLSSEESKFAEVDLRGKLENYAPFEITGKINPLRDDLFVDLKVDFKDMDLSPLTPYSGRYLGYAVQKGKLSLNLQYLIAKKKLDAQNNVFLDQFTLGENVESPDATKLPVRLAIALLKDRKGEIKLDIPVSGYINDPQFSIGRIILKILVNLLVKAATSPFALLGSLVGGGEEMSYVEFDYGLAHIKDAEARKLEGMLKALKDRPSLKVEIEGHADIEKDRDGLRQYLFDKKVKTQKMKETAQKSGAAVSVDDIKVESAEYQKYLKMAYREEKFPKPRNIIGMAKDLPVAEMEKLMLTNIEVKDQDLRQLASKRALEVKDRLLKSKQIEQERIFLVEPKSIQPEKKEKVKDSRVDFRLK